MYDSEFLKFQETSATKTLGIFEPIPQSLCATKRQTLSAVAIFFDPIGWSAPITIKAKILMPQLWLQWRD